MSIATRIKDARISLGLTQEQLAKKIGVTKGAIANYENGISVPKVDLLYKLMRTLQVDANYIYQDEMDEIQHENITRFEMENIIKKYRTLDQHGQEAVNSILEIECKRMDSIERLKKQKESVEFTDNLIPIATRQLPFPLQSSSAGYGDYIDDNSATMIQVIDNKYTVKADYLMRIHGDSMEPEFSNNDIVLVREQPNIEIGEIGIFVDASERYIKVLEFDHLHSLNQKYDDIPLTEEFRCLGRVICKLEDDWVVK